MDIMDILLIIKIIQDVTDIMDIKVMLMPSQTYIAVKDILYTHHGDQCFGNIHLLYGASLIGSDYFLKSLIGIVLSY